MTEEQSKPTLDSRFIIQRQGKDFVLFAGLLDLAHQMGLESITTSPVILPIDAQGDFKPEATAVVQCEVKMADGRTFTGIGDANKMNVGRTIAPHIIRMAETRAKARALRDATNIGMTAHEELGGDDEEQEQEKVRKAQRAGRSTPTPLLASDEQKADLIEKANRLGGSLSQLEDSKGKPFGQWQRKEAQQMIDQLQSRLEKQEAKG